VIRLVVLGGTGDAYLVCALIEAFRATHNRDDVEVILHPKLAAVAAMFPDVHHRLDEGVVRHAEDNQAFQRTHDNQLFASDTFYVHPCFARSGVRIDQLTAKENISQADMYRAMLHLPPDALLTLPRLPQSSDPIPNLVLMLTEATSWPNTQPAFWTKLTARLEADGHRVLLNDRRWPLGKLFEIAASVEWVIGPQCGVMSILTTGRFSCRKTFASPSVDDYVSPSENWWATRTYPYGYVTKFAGEDYDVDEYKITDDNHDEIVTAIAAGAVVRFPSLGVYDPSPVMTVTMPLTPGDFLDRLAVLTVKRTRLAPNARVAQEREYRRYAERVQTLALPDAARRAYADLVLVHEETYDLLESLIPDTLDWECDGVEVGRHVCAAKLNRDRVVLKNAINAAVHAPYAEVKSYYNASGNNG